MDASRKSVAVTHIHRDMEVTHVAMDGHFSCGGAGGGCIRFRWDRGRLRRNRANPVFHLLDPLCGVTFERPYPESVNQTTQ